MVQDGLVARAQDARDRRIIRITLTPEGEAKAAELVAVAERHEAEVLARHPEAEAIKPVLQDLIGGSG
jgi:DNA-binding MarR family transcriptional regulator